VRDAVRGGKLASAHDVSDGGLACALAEAALGAGIGCQVDLQHLRERGCTPEEALFGEGPGGFLISGEREKLEGLAKDGVAVLQLGKVGGDCVEIAAGDRSLTVDLDASGRAWNSLGERLDGAYR
jgi:phosphoribosylformylglycinamidine synthase